MTSASTIRRRVTRGLAVSAMTSTALLGVLAAPASAASSQKYETESQCRTAQVAYGASSFVRISRSCYGIARQIAPGVYDLENPQYRFDYVARSH